MGVDRVRVTRVILLEAALRLKTTTVLLATAAAGGVFLINGGATAAQPGVDSATGGGQTLVDSQGAGNTIAFTARGTADAATGQVQYVDRSGGTGQDQVVAHGTVTCVEATGNVAQISGTWTSGPNEGETFYLYVEDNGQGSAADDDMVAMTPISSQGCSDDANPDNSVALARGNAQVDDGYQG